MADGPFNASLIGFGYWGPNLARNISSSPHYRLAYISDTSSERLDAARRSYQSAECVSDPSVALSDPDIDIVFISTPVGSHRELALAAIRNGKHVLVEKPLALDASSAAELVTLADANGVLLAVDHTPVFTGAVRKLRELVSTGEIGDLRYFDSMRSNLGLVQPDINVLWDLAIHDLSILQFVTEKRPVSVSASGIAHSPSIHESTAYLTLFYEDDFIAHVGTSWMSPVKVRRALIGGTRRMVVYDDIEPGEKIQVYDSGVDKPSGVEASHQTLVQYRTGDMFAPPLETKEALVLLMDHLASCIRGQETLLIPGRTGVEIVEVLEAANVSLSNRGSPVSISSFSE